MGAAAIPLVAIAGGALLQRRAINKAEKKRNQQLSAMFGISDENSRKNIDLVEDAAAQYDPTSRAGRLEEQAGKAQTSLTDYLVAARDRVSGDGYSGKVSDAAVQHEAKRGLETLNQAKNIARLMGRMRAPGDLMREESFYNADTAAKRATNASNTRSRLGAEQLVLNSIEPDDTQMLLGQIAQTAGTVYGMGMAGAPAASGGGAAWTGSQQMPSMTFKQMGWL